MSWIFRCFLVFAFLSAFHPACSTYAASEALASGNPDVQQMKEYVISDSRLPALQADTHSVPAKITVITAQDIQKLGARTIQEAMQYATGIVMYNEVGNAFEDRIDLRGFNSTPAPSITVFLDGMRINEPSFNNINFDLIPFETIERIEIIPGPQAIFGQNSLGGTINIVTKTGAAKRQVTGEVAYGSFNHERFNLNVNGPVGVFNYFLNATQESETGFRDESGGRVFRFFSKFGYHPSDQTDVNLSYTYVKDHLSQAGASPIRIAEVNPEANVTPGDFFDRENNVVRLNVRQELPFGMVFSSNGYYRNLQQASFLVSIPFSLGAAFPTSFSLSETETWGGTFQLAQMTSILGIKNNAIMGVEVAWNQFDSETAFAFQDSDEEVLGLFAQDSIHLLPNLILSGGLRFDQSEIEFSDKFTPTLNNSRDFDRITPRAGITYLITPQASVYFSYSQGFRVPTVSEMFAIGGGFSSNPNLAPVRSHNFEVGGKAQIGSWSDISIALFQSNLKDEIFLTCLVCDFSAFDGINRNLEKTRRRGIEVTLKVRPSSSFDGSINYTFTEAQFQSMQTLGSGGSGVRVVDVGDSLPLVPKNRLSVIGNYYPFEGTTLTLMGLYVSSQIFQNDEGNSQATLPGYFVLNGKASYQRSVPGGIMKAFLQLNNILGNDYFTRGIYAADRVPGGDGSTVRFVIPAPGFAMFGGLSYEFNSFPNW